MNASTPARWTPGSPIGAPLQLYRCQVESAWIDYNGHMTESSYLWAFGEASDALFRYAGIDEAYRAAGLSFYTVETHLNFYKQMLNGEAMWFTTQLLGLDEKRLHLFHAMYRGAGDLAATAEQMLLHVDRLAVGAAPIAPAVYSALSAILAAHQPLPRPSQAGRPMAIKRQA